MEMQIDRLECRGNREPEATESPKVDGMRIKQTRHATTTPGTGRR